MAGLWLAHDGLVLSVAPVATDLLFRLLQCALRLCSLVLCVDHGSFGLSCRTAVCCGLVGLDRRTTLRFDECALQIVDVLIESLLPCGFELFLQCCG